MVMQSQHIEKFTTTNVFQWNYQDKHRIKINQGGTSSGKTYAILQVIFLRLIEKKRIATVIGQDIPNLKKGALRDFQERILVACPWMNNFIVSYNKTERRYKFKNGSILEFTSFKDEQDAKNGKREIAFFNEANGIEYAIYKQVALRTSEEIYLDYNPSAEFWAHEKLMQKPEAITFYSNFTHNPYVDDNVRSYIMDLKKEDLEAWNVYGLGKTGTIAELCIEKINVIEKMPRYLKRRGYGMDFGYKAHPTAFIECGLRNNNQIFIDERFYVYNMKMLDMHIAFQTLGIPRKRKIFADPAETRVIDDLSDRGWRMAEVIKGADSIRYGLRLLNQYELFVTERSLNTINERKKYRYKVDPKTGQITNIPIDAFNHSWDAIRYWAMMNVKPLRPIKTRYRAAVA